MMISFEYVVLAGSIIWLLRTNKNYRIFYIQYKTFTRDLRAVVRYFRFNVFLLLFRLQDVTVAKQFTKIAKKYPTKIAFHFEDQSWSYYELEIFSNKVANYYKDKYQKGDTLALLLENRLEYIGIWLGLSKIGVTTALLNTNLVSDALAHSIKVANCRGVIFGENYIKAINSINGKVSNELKYYQFNDKPMSDILETSINLAPELEKQSTISPETLESVHMKDKLLYIYTSGTTGLPKAAIITNLRFIYMAGAVNLMCNLSTDDITYNPLPLYHSAGGILATGQSLLFGLTVVIRKKFSASHFWTDCQKYKCTVAHYIGEMCRYLLNVHKDGAQVEHNVTKMLGNGLRAQIWQKFVDTFKVKQVIEFYGATESNSNLVNLDGKLGAVGFMPWFGRPIYPVRLVKCDLETGEPIRDHNGLCINCKTDEPGLLLGKIKATNDYFCGYADQEATQKKVLRNVFSKGDAYFNSGDVLVQDELGYFYFRDRTGDTFRWKGENVATNQVEAAISNIIDLTDCVVYGVEVPGTEGRAGMVAIVDADDRLDKTQFAIDLKNNLPSYSIPMFMRILKEMPITGTFKLKKTDLQKDGFNIDAIQDQIYYLNAKTSNYVPLTRQIYQDIISGTAKL